jgi:hypothetical protein
LDIYDDDILEFWKTLSQFEVEFIMVGALPPIFMAITGQHRILMFG